MNRIRSIYFSAICLLLLIQMNINSVQSIALSNLCGQFGHSCFGGNWGKRELYPSTIIDRETDESPHPIDETPTPNLLLEQLRSNLFRERLRQLLDVE